MALLEDQPYFFKIWINEILPNNCTDSYNVDIESNTLPLYLQVYTEFILCSSILLELPILRIVRLNFKRFFFFFQTTDQIQILLSKSRMKNLIQKEQQNEVVFIHIIIHVQSILTVSKHVLLLNLGVNLFFPAICLIIFLK